MSSPVWPVSGKSEPEPLTVQLAHRVLSPSSDGSVESEAFVSAPPAGFASEVWDAQALPGSSVFQQELRAKVCAGPFEVEQEQKALSALLVGWQVAVCSGPGAVREQRAQSALLEEPREPVCSGPPVPVQARP